MAEHYAFQQGIPWGEGFGPIIVAVDKLEKALGKTFKRSILNLGSPEADYFCSMASYLFFMEKKHFNLIINQIKTVNFYAEKALKEAKRKTVNAFEKISEQYSQDQEQLIRAYDSIQKREDVPPIKSINIILNAYHTFYEQGYKTLITFPVISKLILVDKKKISKQSIDQHINNDPSYKTQILNSPLIVGGFQTAILLEGYDNHIRNAVAHKHIEFPDPDCPEVELFDLSKKKKVIWRRTFRIEELMGSTNSLWRTIKALELSLKIFNINNITEIARYSSYGVSPPSPTEIKHLLFSVFHSMGFDIAKINKKNFDHIRIAAKLRPSLTHSYKGASELLWVEGGVPHKAKLRPIDFSVVIKDNAIGAFIRSRRVFEWFKQVSIVFVDNSGREIAMIKCDKTKIFFMKYDECKNKKEGDVLLDAFCLYSERPK